MIEQLCHENMEDKLNIAKGIDKEQHALTTESKHELWSKTSFITTNTDISIKDYPGGILYVDSKSL